MAATLAALHRYPVKGLAPEALAVADVVSGGGLPGDRAFAIARGGTAYDEHHPRWFRKEAFVMLMRDGDEAIARLSCRWQDAGEGVVLGSAGVETHADLRTPEGRATASAILNALLGARPDGPVRVVPAGALSLTDIPQNGLSIVNLASVADFAARIGRPVDPLRFRANLYLDGLPPWIERTWLGKTIRVGRTTLSVAAHIQRCNAIRVDPVTTARDLDALRLLREHYGHVDMGVYADVATDGRLAVGDRVETTTGSAPSVAATRFGRAAFYLRNGWTLVRSLVAR